MTIGTVAYAGADDPIRGSTYFGLSDDLFDCPLQ
jgi:hypothetical protein